jgi:hypothetical protein
MTGLSAVLYISFAFLVSLWIGPIVRFAFAGMLIGTLLGLLGLALTRWEAEPEGLFYTPSRWLALLITIAITARFVYGWWHATHPAINSSAAQSHWLTSASGTQLSAAVAGGLIGYYFVYSIGVRLRLRHHERLRLK